MRRILSLMIVLCISVAAALAQSDGRPLVVLVHSADCKVCAQVRPIFDELEKEFKDRATFVRLDVTAEPAKKESRKSAKTLGVSSFLSFYEDTYPAVGVFRTGGPKPREIEQLYGLKKKDDYIKALAKAGASK